MTSTRPLRRALVAAVALVLVVGACGGDDSDGDADDTTTTTASTTTVADDTGDDETTPTTDDGTGEVGEEAPEGEDGEDGEDGEEGEAPEQSAELQGVVLTLDDLPDGYTQDETTESSSMADDEGGLCEGDENVSFPTPSEEAEVSFQADDFSAFVSSFAARFDEGAEQALAFLRDEAERCAESELGTVTLEETGQGDEGVVLTITDESGAAAIHAARVGDVFVGLAVFAEPDSDLDGAALLDVMVSRA